MSVLLKEIRSTSRNAARVLEEADLRTDSEIQSLTREDLHELFPGHEKLKLRRNIFEIIHKQKPVDVLLRELKAFIPHESVRAALTTNGVLVDYLCVLKDMKTQMNYVQSFLDAHIGLLEELSKNQPDQESDKGSLSSTSAACGPVSHNGQTDGHPQGAQDSWPGSGPSDASGQISADHPQAAPSESLPGTGTSDASGQMVLYTNPPAIHLPAVKSVPLPRWPSQHIVEVMYKKVVSGKTFGAECQLMDKINGRVQDRVQLQLIESNEDCHITFVFCPISSRIGSDVDAAMSDVKDDKPVILVLMHHTREPKHTPSMRTWSHYSKVVLHVSVFFHEVMHGLLKCGENNAAVSEIQNKLLEYGTQRSGDTSGNALSAGRRTGNAPVRDGGNNKGSDFETKGSYFSTFWRK